MFLFAEAIVLISVLYFGSDFTVSLKVLYIAVFTIVNYLAFSEFLFSFASFGKDDNHGAASLGIRWYFVMLYSIVSVAALFVLTFLLPVSAVAQYIVQLSLFLIFLIGMVSGLLAGNIAAESAASERRANNTKERLTATFRKMELALTGSGKEGAEEVRASVKQLGSELIYFVPSDSPEAGELDFRLISLADSVLSGIQLGQDMSELSVRLNEFKMVLANRKGIYSN